MEVDLQKVVDNLEALWYEIPWTTGDTEGVPDIMGRFNVMMAYTKTTLIFYIRDHVKIIDDEEVF